MKDTTIVSRFMKAFGELVPSPRAPFLMGKDLMFYGLTTKLQQVTGQMILKYIQEQKVTPSMQIIEASKLLPEYVFNIGDNTSGDEIIWNEDRLLSGFHILSSKPFEKLKVQYFPNHSIPIAVTREDSEYSVLIAPRILPYYNGHNPFIDAKPQARWMRQMKDSTFWLVEYDVFNNRGIKTGVAEIIKCYNCRVELSVQDYANQIIQRKHPECVCTCNTWDDFCGCIRIRLFNQMMKESRSLHYVKRAIKYAN